MIGVIFILEICENYITGFRLYNLQRISANLLDPDTEADMATVIGLRILTRVCF